MYLHFTLFRFIIMTEASYSPVSSLICQINRNKVNGDRILVCISFVFDQQMWPWPLCWQYNLCTPNYWHSALQGVKFQWNSIFNGKLETLSNRTGPVFTEFSETDFQCHLPLNFLFWDRFLKSMFTKRSVRWHYFRLWTCSLKVFSCEIQYHCQWTLVIWCQTYCEHRARSCTEQRSTQKFQLFLVLCLETKIQLFLKLLLTN